ncbi:hypothetical protein SDC9_73627 [bioreactor metagenome]|uniref:Uncharacterized protein n=1 Tax=bioreactor metagenome TaxID=1076179 RepID=A0A644YEU1_9ZZZZ
MSGKAAAAFNRQYPELSSGKVAVVLTDNTRQQPNLCLLVLAFFKGLFEKSSKKEKTNEKENRGPVDERVAHSDFCRRYRLRKAARRTRRHGGNRGGSDNSTRTRGGSGTGGTHHAALG